MLKFCALACNELNPHICSNIHKRTSWAPNTWSELNIDINSLIMNLINNRWAETSFTKPPACNFYCVASPGIRHIIKKMDFQSVVCNSKYSNIIFSPICIMLTLNWYPSTHYMQYFKMHESPHLLNHESLKCLLHKQYHIKLPGNRHDTEWERNTNFLDGLGES